MFALKCAYHVCYTIFTILIVMAIQMQMSKGCLESIQTSSRITLDS